MTADATTLIAEAETDLASVEIEMITAAGDVAKFNDLARKRSLLQRDAAPRARADGRERIERPMRQVTAPPDDQRSERSALAPPPLPWEAEARP
jgi:hypothetical protein